MNYLYIVDNKCYYKDKNGKIHEINYTRYTFVNGHLNDEKNFYLETYNYLHNHHLVNIFLNKKVTLIHNPMMLNPEIEIIKNNLEKMNYSKTNVINQISLLELETTNYLEINKDYSILYYQDKYKQEKYKFLPSDFYLTKEEYYQYISNIIQDNNDNPVYVYGQLVDIKELELLTIPYYILEYPNLHALNSVPK
jgi:hypothetical protein